MMQTDLQTENNHTQVWNFILFPALAMMLGWGLRGHIGGGPFGAMIPGAMTALSLSLLLKLPANASSVIAVFGAIGIGLGGQMTYGQTVGFLMVPETVWWGTLGTTVKGSVWGLLGATVFSIGFIYRQLSFREIIYGLLLMILGIFAGIKLINEPMIIYFSNPQNPRSESWAGLLTGAIFLLTYLRFRMGAGDFRHILKFAVLGMIGGGMGFGIGGFWRVLGSTMPDVNYIDWWKGMEFTFGFLLGAFLGYAAWLSRDWLRAVTQRPGEDGRMYYRHRFAEVAIILLTVLLTFWVIPYLLRTAASALAGEGSGNVMLINIIRIIGGFAVRGALFFVVIIMVFPG
jgi:hypothetical protein